MIAYVKDLIQKQLSTEILPFESIEASPTYRMKNFKEKVDSIILNGYPIRPSYLFDLNKPMPWFHSERTVSYNLNSFEPLALLLKANCIYGRRDCFNKSVFFLKDWLKNFRPPSSLELQGRWSESEKKDFMWYDMAVGLRACRLSYIVDRLMRELNPDLEFIQKLIDVLNWHKEYMLRDETFRGHNNHGLYQSLGQIILARRFKSISEMEELYELGVERLSLVFNKQFFSDGMHREHSPGYHWMILGTLIESVKAGLINDKSQLDMISKIEKSVSYFIKPNLSLAAFGDTDSGTFKSDLYSESDFTCDRLKYFLSKGKEGNLPEVELQTFPESGYAFFRKHNSSNPQQQTYFAQQAGFHSLTHKHADHLTIEWYDKGQDILVDSGRFGYKGKTEYGSELWKQGFWYSHPDRIYVEKTRAHNTVEIDNLDFPRRKVKPFGSAIKRSTSIQNTVFAIESECRVFSSIRFNRLVLISPAQFLIAIDWLKDNKEENHNFSQWFHLGQNLDLKASSDERVDVFMDNKPFASMVSLLPDISIGSLERGAKNPDLNGWVAHEKGGTLLPNWAVSFSALFRDQLTFATLISLSPRAEIWEDSVVSPSGQSGRLCWKDERGYHKVAFKRRPDEEISLHYRHKREPFSI